jgi:hypothetical protein
LSVNRHAKACRNGQRLKSTFLHSDEDANANRERTHQLTTTKFGADQPEALRAMNNLALCYQVARKMGIVLVRGKIVVGDAMLCQRDLADKVIDSGGDYIFTVKDNQPGLGTDIRAGFGFAAAGPLGQGSGQGARAVGGPDPADHVDPDLPRDLEVFGARL